MHVHACYKCNMRTTIDLPDSLRAKLVEIAARRGEKGFSGLVAEAVTRYLADLDAREALTRRAASALGTLNDEDAEALRTAVRELRERWR